MFRAFAPRHRPILHYCAGYSLAHRDSRACPRGTFILLLADANPGAWKNKKRQSAFKPIQTRTSHLGWEHLFRTGREHRKYFRSWALVLTVTARGLVPLRCKEHALLVTFGNAVFLFRSCRNQVSCMYDLKIFRVDGRVAMSSLAYLSTTRIS